MILKWQHTIYKLLSWKYFKQTWHTICNSIASYVIWSPNICIFSDKTTWHLRLIFFWEKHIQSICWLICATVNGANHTNTKCQQRKHKLQNTIFFNTMNNRGIHSSRTTKIKELQSTTLLQFLSVIIGNIKVWPFTGHGHPH